MGKEFFPLESWQDITEIIEADNGIDSVELFLNGKENQFEELCKELNKALLKSSSAVQNSSTWTPVRESINYQHKAEIELIPDKMTKAIKLTVDVGNDLTGIESKLIGKNTQSTSKKISFNVRKLPPSHALYTFSGRNLSAQLIIKNVLKPPFHLPPLEPTTDAKETQDNLLEVLRHLPFDMSLDFSKSFENFNFKNEIAKKIKGVIINYLEAYAKIPDSFKRITQEKITAIGTRFDPEMELSYLESIYAVFNGQKNRYTPATFIKHIEKLFDDRFTKVLETILRQITVQQKDIKENFKEFSEIENDKQRYDSLIHEFQRSKEKGAGEEVLRRQKQDIKKISDLIQTKKRKYETSKGIILIQELYLNSLEKNESFEHALSNLSHIVDGLKKHIQANHLSVRRDLEKLAHDIGAHAKHILVQHAIYTDVEPDLNEIVALDDIGSYDDKDIQGVLNLIPSLKNSLGNDKVTATKLLQKTFSTNISQSEQTAFKNYIDNHPNPKNNKTYRFTQQLDQFLEVKKVGTSMTNIQSFVENELLTLKTVVLFAAEHKKLTTDFKNHLKFYDKLFIQPYLDLLEEANHESFDELDMQYGRVQNTMKSELSIKYSISEEKALLSTFKQINSQLNNEKLFTVNVFTKQIKNFMNNLNKHKKFISGALMKKVLETYTVFLMGSSRMKGLSRTGNNIKGDSLDQIRSRRADLTETSKT